MLQIVRTTTQHIETIKQFLQLEQMEEIIDVDIEGMFSIVDEFFGRGEEFLKVLLPEIAEQNYLE